MLKYKHKKVGNGRDIYVFYLVLRNFRWLLETVVARMRMQFLIFKLHLYKFHIMPCALSQNEFPTKNNKSRQKYGCMYLEHLENLHMKKVSPLRTELRKYSKNPWCDSF